MTPRRTATSRPPRRSRRDMGTRSPWRWGSAVTRRRDRKSTRLNSSHSQISYAVFCLKKKKKYHPSSLHHTLHHYSTASRGLHYYRPMGCQPIHEEPAVHTPAYIRLHAHAQLHITPPT